jgi:hypothetical protein
MEIVISFDTYPDVDMRAAGRHHPYRRLRILPFRHVPSPSILWTNIADQAGRT